MKRKLSLALIFFFSLAHFVFADSKVEINIQADKSKISISDDIELTITIKQKQENNIDLSKLQVTWIGNFDILWQSSSTSMQIINNDVESISSLLYHLKPKTIWKFTLWPASIEINWTNYKTNTISLDVLDSTKTNSSDLQELSNQTEIPVLYYILWFFVILIIGLFVNYNIFIKNSKEIPIKSEKIEKFSLDLDVNDDNFEAKIDDFIRNYLEKKYDIKTSSHTYKEIYELLKRKKFSSQNLDIIDKIFSFLIINKYSTYKVWNREEIIKNIKSLEE